MIDNLRNLLDGMLMFIKQKIIRFRLIVIDYIIFKLILIKFELKVLKIIILFVVLILF